MGSSLIRICLDRRLNTFSFNLAICVYGVQTCSIAIAIRRAHCSRAQPPFVSTANCDGPTAGPIASFTIRRAQLHAALTKAEPIPMGRCGCLYVAPCCCFKASMATTSFFSGMTSVAEDMMSAVFLGTSPATTAVSTRASAEPQARSLASSSRCSFLQPFLWGDDRGVAAASQVRNISRVTTEDGCSSREAAAGPK